jgi:Protein of unknown function (DUF1194)
MRTPWMTLTRFMRFSVLAVVLFCVTPAIGVAQTSAPPMRVDLELIIAVDISLSMDPEEQRLQRGGYVAALRDPEFHKAALGGAAGRIAITYFEWAGPSTQRVVLPWTLIDSVAKSLAVAETLAGEPISRERLTSISGALKFADRLFDQSPFRGARRVIDVSGDGPNNSGTPVVPTRDQLVEKGIVINGLPIMLKTSPTSSVFDIPNLDNYYAECVIGGPGAFVIPIKTEDEFLTATRRKLILEISGLADVPRLIRVQAPAPAIDCMIGEQLWRRYMDGRAP